MSNPSPAPTGATGTGPSYYGTLTANAVDMITMLWPMSRVAVVNRDGADEIFYTIDGSTPVIEGYNCYHIPAVVGAKDVRSITIGRFVPPDGCCVVKLISSGTPRYGIVEY